MVESGIHPSNRVTALIKFLHLFRPHLFICKMGTVGSSEVSGLWKGLKEKIYVKPHSKRSINVSCSYYLCTVTSTRKLSH